MPGRHLCALIAVVASTALLPAVAHGQLAVNAQVTDAVTQTNVKLFGEALDDGMAAHHQATVDIVPPPGMSACRQYLTAALALACLHGVSAAAFADTR